MRIVAETCSYYLMEHEGEFYHLAILPGRNNVGGWRKAVFSLVSQEDVRQKVLAWAEENPSRVVREEGGLLFASLQEMIYSLKGDAVKRISSAEIKDGKTTKRLEEAFKKEKNLT